MKFWSFINFPGVTWGPTPNLGSIGSGFDVYWTQTDRQTNKQSIYIDYRLIIWKILLLFNTLESGTNKLSKLWRFCFNTIPCLLGHPVAKYLNNLYCLSSTCLLGHPVATYLNNLYCLSSTKYILCSHSN